MEVNDLVQQIENLEITDSPIDEKAVNVILPINDPYNLYNGFEIYDIIMNNPILHNVRYWVVFPNSDKYAISSLGEIYSYYRKSCLAQHITNDGYLRLGLRQTGEQKMYFSHRLMTQAFIKNPENLPTVDHLNRKRKDNRIVNLRWSSLKDQSKNQEKKNIGRQYKVSQYDKNTCELIRNWSSVKDAALHIKELKSLNIQIRSITVYITSACNGLSESAYGYFWRYTQEISPDEEIADIPDCPNYYITSKGRIYHRNGREIFGSKSNGYLAATLKNIKGETVTIKIHELMSKTFHDRSQLCPNGSTIVLNHKNLNKTDNSIDNLEIITQSENIKHAHDSGKYNGTKSQRRPVVQLTLNGDFIAEFASISEAERKTGVDQFGIWGVCNGINKQSKGFKWMDKCDYEKLQQTTQ